MANPLYYRSTNPGLAGVTARASKLFEWDGSGLMPTEIQNGKAFMPPVEISGETVIWSDTYTLGYTNEANATPVFFSDAAAGDVKILEMINHIAGRLGQTLFTDLMAAKAWIATVEGVDFVEAGAGTQLPNRTYKLNPTILNGSLVWSNGSTNYSSGSAQGGPWPEVSGLLFTQADVNGVNHLSSFTSANKIAFYVDQNNYVKWNITSTITTVHEGYPAILINFSNMVAVGQRPPQVDGSINPQPFTLLLGSEVDAIL